MGVGVWQYLSGYVMIEVKGKRLERFINRAIQSGVEIWRIRRTGAECVSARVSVKGFYALRPILRECGVRVAIVGKRGPIMALSRMRERKVLLFGWMLVLALLLAASRCIWFITVEGCDRVSETQVLQTLKGLGVEAGSLRSGTPTYRLGAGIMASDERIAWAGAELEGVILRITIVESALPPEQEQNAGPASIYARCDGIIRRVVVTDGKAKVVAGEAVVAGQELISGFLRAEEDGGATIMTRAKGEITAEVLYRFTATAGPMVEDRLPTGRQERFCEVELFGFTLRPQAEFDDCREETVETLRFQGCFLPLTARAVVCRETELGTRAASREELAAMALKKAGEEMLRRLPKDAKITSKKSGTEPNGEGGVTAILTVTTEENIGVTRGIDGTENG